MATPKLKPKAGHGGAQGPPGVKRPGHGGAQGPPKGLTEQQKRVRAFNANLRAGTSAPKPKSWLDTTLDTITGRKPSNISKAMTTNLWDAMKGK